MKEFTNTMTEIYCCVGGVMVSEVAVLTAVCLLGNNSGQVQTQDSINLVLAKR